MSAMQTLKLGTFSEMKYGKMPDKSKLSDSGFPVYSGYRIVGYTNEYHFEEPQLIVVARGVGGTGDVKLSPPKAYITNLSISVVLNPEIADKEYLYYYFKVNNLRYLDSGSAQSQITIADLKNLEVTLPDLKSQKRIAQALRLIDSKIELNSQINQTLESMAKAIFKEWFIDFGPVKAKAKGKKPFGMDGETADLFPDSFKDSELGPIPKEWTISKVKEIGKVICGKTPPTSNKEYYQSNEVPFVTIPDMHNKVFISTTFKYLSRQGAESQENKTLPPGAICVSCIATPGLVSIVTKPSQTNQQINSVIPLDSSLTPYYYHALSQLGNLIKSGGSGGSVFSNLSKGRFEELDILKPDPAIIKAFSKTCTELMDAIKNNDLENNQLKEIRDLLLPKLISGEIELKEIDV